MAYKSKEKLLEIGTGNFSYCTIDPKLGQPCKKHFHSEQSNMTKKEAERLRKLGEELIEMAEETSDPQELYPEEVYDTLGMPQPKPVSAEVANKWMEDNIVEVLSTEPVKDEEGNWLTPDNSSGIKCEECGNEIQLVKLANGLTTWHHPNHAELDTISDVRFHPDNNTPYSLSHVSASAEDWSEEDVKKIQANAEIGSDVGYTWRGTHMFMFARVDGEGQTAEEYTNSNHTVVPAKHCYKCGAQNSHTVKTERGGLFKKFTHRETENCSNCGYSRVLSQY